MILVTLGFMTGLLVAELACGAAHFTAGVFWFTAGVFWFVQTKIWLRARTANRRPPR